MPLDEESKRLFELQDKASDRAYSKNTEPFVVEPFCAQVAWMGKHCPVYPYTAAEPREVCKFLVSDDYETYRCPVCKSPDEIFKPIFERGTPEQRKSLEFLADMTVRYSQNPVGEKNKIWLEVTGYSTLGDAIQIYRGLGLEGKAKIAEQVFEDIWRKHCEEIPVRNKQREEERKKNQEKINRMNKKELEAFFESLKG